MASTSGDEGQVKQLGEGTKWLCAGERWRPVAQDGPTERAGWVAACGRIGPTRSS